MRQFLKDVKKTYCFNHIEDDRADDIEECVTVVANIPYLTTISPVLIFKVPESHIYPAFRNYSSRIKYPIFVLKYIVKGELNFPIEQLYTNDLNVILPIAEVDHPFMDFFEIEGVPKRYVFLDVKFTSKKAGYKTWDDVIRRIAIWDKKSAPILIEKPKCLKEHSCRFVDSTVKPLTTRVILSTLKTFDPVIEKVVELFKIKSYSQRNASNCDKYFDIKNSYRELPFIHPLVYQNRSFINMRLEVSTSISFKKTYDLYNTFIDKSLEITNREIQRFADDFNNEKTLVTSKPASLIKRRKDKSTTWEFLHDFNYAVKILAHQNNVTFSKNAIHLDDEFTFDFQKLDITDIDDLKKNLLHAFEKIKSYLMKMKVAYVE